MDFIEANEYFGTWAPGSAADAVRYLDEIHAAFPGKPIVISEYGYCACTADRPEGDEHRMEILRTHDLAIRSEECTARAIFFCYNDYRPGPHRNQDGRRRTWCSSSGGYNLRGRHRRRLGV